MHTQQFQDAHLHLQHGNRHKSKAPGLQSGYENATTLVTELDQVFMASPHIFNIQKTKSIKELTFPSLQETWTLRTFCPAGQRFVICD